jgi:hypothetical protein
MPILRGPLVGPPRFRPLEPLNEISTHLTVSCLETRCNSATRAWMSSRSDGLRPAGRSGLGRSDPRGCWALRVHHHLPMVAAARDICRNREIDCRRQPRRSPPEALWREGPDGGLGQSASNMPTRPACSAQSHRGPGSPESRVAERGGKVQSLTRAATLSAMPT